MMVIMAISIAGTLTAPETVDRDLLTEEDARPRSAEPARG
jgi:hypothetical protein